MLVDITIRAPQTCMVVQKADGSAVVSIPLDALRRAYCDYVAQEVIRARKPEGAIQ